MKSWIADNVSKVVLRISEQSAILPGNIDHFYRTERISESNEFPMSSIKYRPEIDGLRAIAVVPVILFHMGLNWIAGGFLGVDVFFVISGFLITSIVIKDWESGTFSFRNFWARRIRRILPVLLVVIASSLGFAWFFAFRGDIPPIGTQSLMALFSVANIYFWQATGDYWGTNAEETLFIHTWTLSVEEQFYIFLPIALWLVFRWRKRAGDLMIVVSFLSFCLFLYGITAEPTATFYLLPTRAWELGAGAYLATISGAVYQTDHKKYAWLGMAGLGLICGSYFLVTSLGGGIAVAVTGTLLVIAFARAGMCKAVLSHPWLVYAGKLSFSLYLWHWPVIYFSKQLGVLSSILAQFGFIVLLSVASYHLIEETTRRRQGIIPWIAGGFVTTATASGLLMSTSGLYDTSNFEQQTWYILYYDLLLRDTTPENFERIAGTMNIPDRVAPPDAYLHGGLIIGDGDRDPEIVVLGDSHALMWSHTIRTISDKLGLKSSFYSMRGVSPFVNRPLSSDQQVRHLSASEKYQYDEARLRYIEKWHPLIVFVSVRWSTYANESIGDLFEFLEQHAAHVILIEQPPELDIGNRNALQYLCYQQVHPEDGVLKYLPVGNTESGEQGREFVSSLARSYDNCRVLPTYNLYAKGTQALCLDGRNVVYADDDHLSTFGTQMAVDRLEAVVTEILESSRKQVSE